MDYQTEVPQNAYNYKTTRLRSVGNNQSISGDIVDESTLTGSVPSRKLKSKWPETNVPQMAGRNSQEKIELSPTLHGAEIARNAYSRIPRK